MAIEPSGQRIEPRVGDATGEELDMVHPPASAEDESPPREHPQPRRPVAASQEQRIPWATIAVVGLASGMLGAVALDQYQQWRNADPWATRPPILILDTAALLTDDHEQNTATLLAATRRAEALARSGVLVLRASAVQAAPTALRLAREPMSSEHAIPSQALGQSQ